MKEITSRWFESLQKDICVSLEELEQTAVLNSDLFPKGKFEFTNWDRDGGGGGTMGVLRGGRVFEKAGVNFSAVHGQFSKEFQGKVPGTKEDPSFWACGISLVIHPRSPWVPIVHMNTRMIVTTQSWFGGGADLTPVYPVAQDTDFFHTHLKNTCDRFHPDYYPQFKKECDEYFYIKHRKEMRGVGGIFYDNLNSGDLSQDFEFTKAVGIAFKEIYPEIVKRHYNTPWGEQESKAQLSKRARYVEFNLIYDRGTEFGLKTGGNIDAIFVSLPPLASWG
jgi:coproporphyrinogen III oxidase